jgi:phospholipid/cholesterol/gamma-HCH transport system permease protein
MITALSERIGANIRGKVRVMLYGAGFCSRVMTESGRFFRRNQVGYRVLVMQVLFTGVEALGIISFMSMALGAVLSSMGLALASQFGQGALTYPLLVAVITRELGPLLTAFVIIARSGTAIATEIGGMVVSHEIEAYQAFGIDPISYLVVPRFLGVVFSTVLLTIYFNFFGLLGSYLLSAFIAPVPIGEYMTQLLKVLTPSDLLISCVKALVFGTVISLVACYQGFRVQKASTEVPQAGIRAVGRCFTFCIIADAMLILIYYSLQR